MENNKTIWSLMVDLLSFSDFSLPVLISVNGGIDFKQLRLIVGEDIIEGDCRIKDVIEYLRLNYNDPSLNVRILDGSVSYKISLVGRKKGKCILIHYP